MKMKHNYKVWGILSAIVILLIASAFFLISQFSSPNPSLPNVPVTEAPQPGLPEDSLNGDSENNSDDLNKDGANALGQEELQLYTGDIDSYEKKETGTIKADKSFTLEEKLMLIATNLSQSQFEGLPIEVKGIEEIEGKKIAVINLRENEAANKTWMNYLNAGSAGSRITLVTFEESFLQRDLEGEWIDGIKIIREGEEIEEMDHFPGTQIIYRKK